MPGTIRRAFALALVVLAGTTAGACGGDGADGGGIVRTVTVPGGQGGGSGSEPVGQDELAGADECEDAELLPEDGNRPAVERATLCLVNAERTKRDREPLRDDDALTQAARAKARHMVENDYFAHVGPDGRDVRDWVGDTDYLDGARGHRLGENLGWASEGAATPSRLVRGWMNSAGHRENILRQEFRDSGIGVVLGAPREDGGGATYVQMFGRR